MLIVLLIVVPVSATPSLLNWNPHLNSVSHIQTSQELAQVTAAWSAELIGTGEISVELLKGNPNLGTETLQQVFGNAKWNFRPDGSFSFDPPPEAFVRQDFFPITGTYSKTGDTLQIQGERQGDSGSQVSIDGSIKLEGIIATIDLIYTALAGSSQRIVQISQTLTESRQAETPQTTTIDSIHVPTVFTISLQGTTESLSFEPLSGVLKILAPIYPGDPNPFFVSFQTDTQSQVGSILWTSYAPPQVQVGQDELYSAIHVTGNQIRLELHPSQAARTDVSWFTSEPGTLGALLENEPIGTTTVQSGQITFSIQGSRVTGEISASGTTLFERSTSYQAKFTGQISSPASDSEKQLLSKQTAALKAQDSTQANTSTDPDPAPDFNSVWDTLPFGQIKLQQQD